MNKFYFTLPDVSQGLQLPLEMKWDFDGRNDSIEVYEDEILETVIGVPTDYEILRFSHNEHLNSQLTDINYQFNFFSGNPITVTSSTISNWVNSYLAEGYSTDDLYYYRRPFTKSFFKLDFYDTPNTTTQINYLTIIIPTQQGDTMTGSISPIVPFNNVKIKKPKFKLDYVGDKEGFFLYWLRKKDFLDISTFYMSGKFFNANKGEFVRMMNRPQSLLPNKFIFNSDEYFYYKVELNYSGKTYQVTDYNNSRIGTTTPILWYEYINPPQ